MSRSSVTSQVGLRLMTPLLGLALTACGVIPATAAGPVATGASPAAGPVPVSTSLQARNSTPETVVLLHGLGRTHRSMASLEQSLEAAGYGVVNLGYPSRHYGVHALVDTVAAALDACCADRAGPVHFVTHSLGGILVRGYREAHGPDRIGRVVMLSPPNQGSEVVDRIPEGLLDLVLGPAAVQLGTDSGSVIHRLPPADFELGVITGDASLNPLFSWWLPGDDDGKVTVESARLEGADDFLVVPYSHTWIMQRERVIEQVLAFLETGRFIHDETSSGDGP